MRTQMLVGSSVFALVAALLGPACGDDETGSVEGSGAQNQGAAGPGGGAAACNQNPASCAPGTTCWLVQGGFGCLPSGMGMEGDACLNYVGMATCADGLMCFQLQGEMEGVCRPFCDPAMPMCPNGAPCVGLLFDMDMLPDLYACQPEGQGGGGMGGMGGAGGAPGGGGAGGA